MVNGRTLVFRGVNGGVNGFYGVNGGVNGLTKIVISQGFFHLRGGKRRVNIEGKNRKIYGGGI